MKNERLVVLFSKAIQAFIKENEFDIELLHKLSKQKKNLLIEKLLNYDSLFNDSLNWMWVNREEIGIEEEVFTLFISSFMELVLKRPIVKEGNLAKLSNFVEKIKLITPPEESKEEESKNQGFKALVRIRIPMEEIKESEKPNKEDEESEGEGEGEDPTTP